MINIVPTSVLSALNSFQINGDTAPMMQPPTPPTLTAPQNEPIGIVPTTPIIQYNEFKPNLDSVIIKYPSLPDERRSDPADAEPDKYTSPTAKILDTLFGDLFNKIDQGTAPLPIQLAGNILTALLAPPSKPQPDPGPQTETPDQGRSPDKPPEQVPPSQ